MNCRRIFLILAITLIGYVADFKQASADDRNRLHLKPSLKCTITVIRFSSDSQYLAAGGMSGVVHCWRIKDQTLVAQFKAHSKPIRALRFSKDASRLVSCGSDGFVSIWETATFSRQHRFKASENSILQVSTNDAAMGIYAIDAVGRLTKWQEPFADHALLPYRGNSFSEIVSGGRELITIDMDGILQRINLANGKGIRVYSPASKKAIVYSATPDGKLLAAVPQFLIRTPENRRRILVFPDASKSYQLSTSLILVLGMAMSPDGKLLGICGNDASGQIGKRTTVELFDLKSKSKLSLAHIEGDEHVFVNGANGNCYALSISAAPYQFAYGGTSGTVTLTQTAR